MYRMVPAFFVNGSSAVEFKVFVIGRMDPDFLYYYTTVLTWW